MHSSIDISKTIGSKTDISIPTAAWHCEEAAMGLYSLATNVDNWGEPSVKIWVVPLHINTQIIF